MPKSPHLFHIPVMGTGFTIDTPIHIARFGISSVLSIVNDTLIEQMRKYHAEKAQKPYQAILRSETDARARRITAYLDMMDQIIKEQVTALQAAPFTKGSEITRYFEMLPQCELRTRYEAMLAMEDGEARSAEQNALRKLALPGTIDVNIMTKLDRDAYSPDGETLEPERGEAMAALRGFANSTVEGAIVFSAGLNTRLYNYLSEFRDFFPDADGRLKKKIVLKVSDYRSALIQGRYLAKRGLWISEFRIESSLNCGGHAFATDGLLLGPILQEFKDKREQLQDALTKQYQKALKKLDLSTPAKAPQVAITVQGGIGTREEQDFLLTHYDLDGTGWGTPFMLVPEVVQVDEEHLQKLCQAGREEVQLSDASPLGIPFWNLLTSGSEEARKQRIKENNPGSACPKGHLALNNEFSKVPICTASKVYVKQKLAVLEKQEMPESTREKLKQYVLAKACLCHELSGAALKKLGIDTTVPPAVCCGPNIESFGAVATLEDMIGHIYGRLSLITQTDRPHMFIRELQIYLDYIRSEAGKVSCQLSQKTETCFGRIQDNLLAGIEYYRRIAEDLAASQRSSFLEQLELLKAEVDNLQNLVQPLLVPDV